MLLFSAIVWGQATAQIAGTVRDQLRGEAFNLPNHLNPLITPANLSLNSAQFGRATADQSGIGGQIGGVTSGDYRVIQFALKLAF